MRCSARVIEIWNGQAAASGASTAAVRLEAKLRVARREKLIVRYRPFSVSSCIFLQADRFSLDESKSLRL